MDILNELNIVFKLGSNKDIFATNRINSSTKFFNLTRKLEIEIKNLLKLGKFNPTSKEEQLFLNTYNLYKNKKGFEIRLDNYPDSYRLEIATRDGNCSRVYNQLYLKTTRLLELLEEDSYTSFNFINPKKISEEEILLELLNVKFKDNNLQIKKLKTKSIFVEKRKSLNLGEDLNSFLDFVKEDEIGFFYNIGIPMIMDIIFDNFSYEKGFNNVYGEIRSILKETTHKLDTYDDVIKALYYYSFNDYYYYMEAMIKLDQKDNILKMNPVLTKGDIPKVSDIKTLSSLNSKIMKNNQIFRKSDIEFAIELENDENFGVNGLNIFLETYVLLRELGFSSYFEDMANDCLLIMKTFKINIKNLMERMIREVFYNNIKANEYLRYVVDYIEMCKMLGIELDEKLPKDVIRRHDMLILQMKEVAKTGSSKIEKAFKVANDKNIELLKYVPPGTNLKMYCPESIADLVEKGFKANHCVGSYSGRIINGSSKIFFIEEEGVNGAYFTTFELNKHNELIQAKGFSNTAPRADIMKFIKTFIANIQKEEI